MLHTSALRGRLRTGGSDSRLAAGRVGGRPHLPEDRLPAYGTDRRSRDHLIGSALLTLATMHIARCGRWPRRASCIGMGLGLVASPTLIAAQAAVDWDRRGVVTGNFCIRSVDGQRTWRCRLRRNRQCVAEPQNRWAHLVDRKRNTRRHPRAGACTRSSLAAAVTARAVGGRGADHAKPLRCPVRRSRR